MATADELSPLRGKRVILADHLPGSRTALRDMVSLLGATSIANATNASDVLRLAKARSIDLILCDYQLDGVRDGQQLLEEMRHTKQIPLATMFMMITGERSYQKVVAVAEFAPDDYLLKPFTANQLMERISSVALKKTAFAASYNSMESGELAKALDHLDRIRNSRPAYAADALRLMIEIMLTLKQHDKAEKLLEEVMAQKIVPWAAMGLARIQVAEKRLEEAEAGLTQVVEQNPEYLGAKDLLAEVKDDLGKPEEALAVIEKAGAAATGNVARLRRAGDLAAQTGDHQKASALYEKVMGRVRHSTLAKPEDFVSLANAYMEQGRVADAERVCAEQRRNMRDAPEAVVVSRLMEYQRLRRDPSSPAQEKADAALDALLEARSALGEALPVAVEMDIFAACEQSGRHDDAAAVGERLAGREGVSEKMAERINTALADIQLERKRVAAIVPLDQVLPMLTRLAARGWDEAMGHACRASVAHWGKRTPDAGILAEARERLAAVLKKYGMEAQGDQGDLAPA